MPNLLDDLLALLVHRPTPPGLPSLPIERSEPLEHSLSKFSYDTVLLQSREETGSRDGEGRVVFRVENELSEQEGEERIQLTRREREEEAWRE